MATTMAYDTLSASKRLIEAGADKNLAEAVVEVVANMAGDDVVRKSDIQYLATKTELLATKTDLKAELQLLEERIGAKILWGMIGSVVATTALLSFIIGALVLIQN